MFATMDQQRINTAVVGDTYTHGVYYLDGVFRASRVEKFV